MIGGNDAVGLAENIECYIAPWALVREELPVHLILNSPFEFDSILITLPDGVVVSEFFNVDKYEINEAAIQISKLITSDFFGFAVRQEKVIDGSHAQKPITVQFDLEGQTVFSRTLIANFYRPLLAVLEAPHIVTLDDKSNPKTLFTFKIQVAGFGRVHILTEVDTGTDISIVIESFYRNIMRQIIARYSTSEEIKPDDSKFEDPEWFLPRVVEGIDILYEKELPPKLREEMKHQAREWITNTRNFGKIIEESSKAFEALMLDMLLFQFEKYPAENVSLSHGSPSLYAQSFGGDITLRLRYWDSMGNEFEPLEIPIHIIDKRSQKKPAEIPINIGWIRQPYPVVEEGRRDE